MTLPESPRRVEIDAPAYRYVTFEQLAQEQNARNRQAAFEGGYSLGKDGYACTAADIARSNGCVGAFIVIDGGKAGSCAYWLGMDRELEDLNMRAWIEDGSELLIAADVPQRETRLEWRCVNVPGRDQALSFLLKIDTDANAASIAFCATARDAERAFAWEVEDAANFLRGESSSRSANA